MRKFKLLIGGLCIIMIFTFVVSSVFANGISHSDDQHLIIEGTSFTNLEDTGIKTEKTEELSANLSLTKFEIEDDNIDLEALLHYANEEYKIERKGKVQVNPSDNTKIYLEFYDYLAPDLEIIMANAIIDSVHNTISFVIFNKNNNDLIKLAGSFSGSNSIKIDTLDRSILTEVNPTYELYESKFFIPVDSGVEVIEW